MARNAVGMMSSRLGPTKLLRSRDSDPLLSVDVLHQVGHFNWYPLVLCPKSFNLLCCESSVVIRHFEGLRSKSGRFALHRFEGLRVNVW